MRRLTPSTVIYDEESFPDSEQLARVMGMCGDMIKELFSFFTDQYAEKSILGQDIVRLSPSTHVLIGSTYNEDEADKTRKKIQDQVSTEVEIAKMINEVEQEIEKRLQKILQDEGIVQKRRVVRKKK